MSRRRHRGRFDRAQKSGMSPGTAVYTGDPRTEPVTLSLIDYDAGKIDAREGVSVDAARPRAERPDTVTWVMLDGVHRVDVVETVCRQFGVHPLAMEDILNPGSRPKSEDYGDTQFVVAKMATVSPDAQGHPRVHVEQASMVLGPSWVLTFLEDPGDVFDPVRRRLHSGQGRIRRSSADYLLYALLDAVVDQYFAALEQLEDQVAHLDADALQVPTADIPRMVHMLKGELQILRRAVSPMREAVGLLQHCETRLVQAATLPYLRDVHDHLVQVVDAVDACVHSVGGALEVHLAVASNRMNESMRVLAVVTALFIPLSFLAGVYGMNFKYMPELESRWGYPATLAAMALTAVGMWVWFRRRKWL